jgi:integrase
LANVRHDGKLSAESRSHLHAIDLTFHDLRHEAGSRWTDAGWPLSHVQRMLGHADLRMTSVYTNADLRHLQDSMRRYGTSLPPAARTSKIEQPPTGDEAEVDGAGRVLN